MPCTSARARSRNRRAWAPADLVPRGTPLRLARASRVETRANARSRAPEDGRGHRRPRARSLPHVRRARFGHVRVTRPVAVVRGIGRMGAPSLGSGGPARTFRPREGASRSPTECSPTSSSARSCTIACTTPKSRLAHGDTARVFVVRIDAEIPRLEAPHALTVRFAPPPGAVAAVGDDAEEPRRLRAPLLGLALEHDGRSYLARPGDDLLLVPRGRVAHGVTVRPRAVASADG